MKHGFRGFIPSDGNGFSLEMPKASVCQVTVAAFSTSYGPTSNRRPCKLIFHVITVSAAAATFDAGLVPAVTMIATPAVAYVPAGTMSVLQHLEIDYPDVTSSA
jgi:hypothetical protein